MDLNLGRIGQIAMSVSDVEAAIDFYGTKLGLRQVMRPHESMVFFDCAGLSLFIEKARSPDDIAKCSVLYFNCVDLALTMKELTSRGLEIFSPPHRITEQPTYDLWMAFVKDPDGHLIGVQSQAPKGWTPT